MENKIEYFINQTNQRLERMELKIDRLITFRLMLIGASIGISGLVTVAFNILFLWSSTK